MANEGFYTVGDYLLGYSERTILVQWDIAPDLRSDRLSVIERPFYRIFDARYAAQKHIMHTYMTRWVATVIDGPPGTERNVYVLGVECHASERTCYFYLDTGIRYAFAEGLYTNTPLLLKYPKYYNWSHIPEILTPEFDIWSFYELDTSDIQIKLVGSETGTVVVHSGKDADKFEITKITDNIYHIKVIIDHEWQSGETVTCYISAHDVKGNYLKPGIW